MYSVRFPIARRLACQCALLSLSLAAAMAPSALATTYTATTSAQLTSALNSVLPGDTVIISGTLTGNFVANRSGTAAAPITVQGDGTAVLASTGGYGFEVVNASYYRLQNFIIQGGLKGLVIDNANHGIVDRVHCRDIQQEAFKVRNQSQWWEFTYCSARRTGTSGDFGEGFYVGQASSNWINGVPDQSGFVTFFNCYTTDTVNDGWDCKEGSHDIKMVNCTADFSGAVEPVTGAAHGSAGFYLRADRIQVIKCNVIHLDNSNWAYRYANEVINGTDYGSSGNEIKQSAATLGNVGFIYAETGTNGIVYSDYTNTSSGGFYASGSATVTIGNPASFAERTWTGEGGGVWGDLDANVGADGDPMAAAIVAAPAFTPSGGTYSSAQTVTITTATAGASIRYTTDGSTPSSTTGTLYSGPVTIATTTTLKAIAYKTGMTDSSIAVATYTINVGDFTISATPASSTVARGGSTIYTVTVTGSGGFAGAVNLSVSGLPSRATGSFNPASVTGSGSATLTVTTNRKSSAGTSTLTITGTSGSLSHATTVTLVVQ